MNLSAPASAGPAVATLPVTALVKASGSAGVWALDAKGPAWFSRPCRSWPWTMHPCRSPDLTAGTRVVSVGAQKLDAGLTVRAVERAGNTTPTVVGKSRP
jgi:hypothetical protein